MAKKRKNLNATAKVNPPTNVPVPQKDENTIPFHLNFPFELQHNDKGDKKICWFKDSVDLKKYIARYGLKEKDYKISKTRPKK